MRDRESTLALQERSEVERNAEVDKNKYDRKA